MGDILDNIEEASYHADEVGANQPTLSASIASVLVQKTPKHARYEHPKLNPGRVKEEKEHLDVGTVAHAIILQGHDIVQIVDAKDWRTNDAKEQAKEARAAGKVPLLAAKFDAVGEMVEAIVAQLVDLGVTPAPFTAGKPELTLVWEERLDYDKTDDALVVCRSRIDWLHDDYLWIDDLKTTGRSADPLAFAKRSVYDHGYDVKAAFYERGVEALTGERPTFRWIVVESVPPYALSIVAPGAGVLTIARKKVEFAINLWRECILSGRWPGWSDQVEVAELPDWEEAKWLQRELESA